MNLDVFVLTPFKGPFTFSYQYGIVEAFKLLEERIFEERGYRLSFNVRKADHPSFEKPEISNKIKSQIIDCDLIVADITEGNVNVLWELGFAQASHKPFIIVTQESASWKLSNLPTNIRDNEVIRYECDAKEMGKLQENIVGKAIPILDRIFNRNKSLISNQDLVNIWLNVKDSLGKIKSGTLLENLVLDEVFKADRRIRGVVNGDVKIRNKRKNEDIINTFKDYIDQCNNPESSYISVSCKEFWMGISDNGSDSSFLNSNIHAVNQNAKISRVFILNKKEFPNETVKGDPLLKDVLSSHYHNIYEKDKRKNKIAVLFSSNYEKEKQASENFGVLRKSHPDFYEELVVMPLYPEGLLGEIRYIYFDSREQKKKKNKSLIQKYHANFETLLKKSKALKPEMWE